MGSGGLLVRSYDGHNNNVENPAWGQAGQPLFRLFEHAYSEDGGATLADSERPNPRDISNSVFKQEENEESLNIPNELGVSDFFWQWGQFLDHDLDLTPVAKPRDPADILATDTTFDPEQTGQFKLRFSRSRFIGGTSSAHPRQQVNIVSSWIDGSNVYGSDSHRANALRMKDGTGRLKFSTGNLLPKNTQSLENEKPEYLPAEDFFLAGDVRANEQVGLTVMHTLFMREHNYQVETCSSLAEAGTMERDEDLYQCARNRVIAILQKITYDEFLPLLLGSENLGAYNEYDSSLDGTIRNSFSTASYRFGHSALSPDLLKVYYEEGHLRSEPLTLKNAFFCHTCVSDDGLEPYLLGLAYQTHQKVDARVVNEVRNTLFGPTGDLVALNIQRGRDHGIPTYNQAREALGGLERVSGFDQISSDAETVTRLQSIYTSVDHVDLWVGALAEDHVTGGMVGPTNARILKEQFKVLRDGDRYWYQNSGNPNPLTFDEMQMVRQTTLTKVIKRNTRLGDEMPNNAFMAGTLVYPSTTDVAASTAANTQPTNSPLTQGLEPSSALSTLMSEVIMTGALLIALYAIGNG
ncbi:MAG: peroxidase family protein [Endozoicomonas sp.]|uniref:peroxidase family protein n=1 Tax=Endozoicomonas sp. TaxID=1892382 RepID=UPI003D9B3DF3